MNNSLVILFLFNFMFQQLEGQMSKYLRPTMFGTVLIYSNPFLTNFPLTDKQVVGFYQQNVWKTPVEDWNFSKDADHRPASLLKMQLFHRCFLNILLVKATTWFLYKRNIGRKWVNQICQHLSNALARFKRCHKMFSTEPLLW